MLSERQRRVVVALAALTMAALTARLGFWQLDRGRQKLALEHSVTERSQQPTLDAEALPRDGEAAVFVHHRSIRLQGRWLADRTIYLDNRQMDGRPGFYVLTPLELRPGDAVLVQRGWLPRDATDRSRLAPVVTPPGPVQVFGRIAPPPARLYDFGGAASGPIRQNLALDAYASEIGTALRPLSILQLPDPASATPADGLQRDWPQPASGVERHWGYAFQWFGLCALIVGLYVWFQLIRPRRLPR
jgi:surfeit locus 1 family protein